MYNYSMLWSKCALKQERFASGASKKILGGRSTLKMLPSALYNDIILCTIRNIVHYYINHGYDKQEANITTKMSIMLEEQNSE